MRACVLCVHRHRGTHTKKDRHTHTRTHACTHTHTHTQHLCCCCCTPQWTGLAYWCWRCWRFRRSAACNWRSASTNGPLERVTSTRVLSLRGELTCWRYSTERLQPSCSLHPGISSTYTHHGERMQYMTHNKVPI